jgi:hypothetical protein
MAKKPYLVEIRNPFVTEEEDQELDYSEQFTLESAASTVEDLREQGKNKFADEILEGFTAQERRKIEEILAGPRK